MSKEHNVSPEAIALAARQFGRVLDLFADRLDAAGQDAGGQITRAEIDKVLSVFKHIQDPGLVRLYVEIWDVLEQAAEEAHWSRIRTQPLERLVVQSFEDILAERGVHAVAGRTISRRMLPGFLTALKQMIGPEMLEEYERRSRELVEAERRRVGDVALWAVLERSHMAHTIVNDVLVYVARYFTNVAKRRAWLIDQIGRNLSPAAPDVDGAAHFGDQEFHMLMERLYRPLADMLATESGRMALDKRYGPANLATLEQVILALKQERAELGPAAA